MCWNETFQTYEPDDFEEYNRNEALDYLSEDGPQHEVGDEDDGYAD